MNRAYSNAATIVYRPRAVDRFGADRASAPLRRLPEAPRDSTMAKQVARASPSAAGHRWPEPVAHAIVRARAPSPIAARQLSP